MTTFLLVRHAAHALMDAVLVGRMADVGLDETGRAQASRLAERLGREQISAIRSSPRERARQTAQRIGQAAGVPVEIAAEIDEIDAGEWTGRRFEELAHDPRWKLWNAARSKTQPPAGESMAQVQRRAVELIERERRADPHGRVLIVTHAEVIRAMILYYLGLPLDAFGLFEISPAAMSTVTVDDWGAKIVALNERVSV